MITCLGIIVGAVESPYQKDILKTCVKFLYSHRYLLRPQVQFYINNVLYATVLDIDECSESALFILESDGRWAISSL